MAKNLLSILEEVQEELEVLEEAGLPPEQGADAGAPPPKPKAPVDGEDGDGDEDDDADEDDENLSDAAPDGKGHYTADDLREIVDYVRDLIEKELKDDDDAEDGDAKEDDIGEIGLDLIYEYADMLPETVINQIVDDLKDMFEIEDTMLEKIMAEGSTFFAKSKKGPAAKAAMASMKKGFIKNIKKIKKRNSKWRNTELGKKMAALHKKIFKSTATMHKCKGKRVVHKEEALNGKI